MSHQEMSMGTPSNVCTYKNRFFLADFVSIQRNSFLNFLEKGLIEEFAKLRSSAPITNRSKTLEVFFYPEYYQLTRPKYSLRQAILKGKSYLSRLYVPVQLTDKKSRIIQFKWVYIADVPIMTKRGHFIINGAARVVINQIIRSPGIYFQTKTHQKFSSKWATTAISEYDRHYADIICQRGTWLRFEIAKDKKIWAQTKKGPKIPIMTFLLAMGLTDKMIFKSVIDPTRLVYQMVHDPKSRRDPEFRKEPLEDEKPPFEYPDSPPAAWGEIYRLYKPKKSKNESTGGALNQLNTDQTKKQDLSEQIEHIEQGRLLIFNKFMNPRTYDLSKQGRLNFNKKFNLSISPYQTTLTPQDILAAINYLLKVEYGFEKADDIDHLKNRRVRTSGELIQMQFGIGLVRLEKTIREKIKNIDTLAGSQVSYKKTFTSQDRFSKSPTIQTVKASPTASSTITKASTKSPQELANANNLPQNPLTKISKVKTQPLPQKVSLNSLINTKAVNSVLREFFGTSPLSQFMDQINPLAELTHKRRLSSMGPGGVTRDSATLDIRGIHPSHYGRICPVETPEGKNTGLVNSLTTYARVNEQGFIETPFYKVYKGQVQKKLGMFYFAAEHEAKIKLGAADLFASDIGFLSKAKIPVRIEEEFSKISRDVVEYVGVSPTQMVSIATSLIPFLEHDDANRALMGSNMQRQAVPLLKPERPIVGTGLEARAVSDSGHALQTNTSGLVTYVSADKIIIYTDSGA